MDVDITKKKIWKSAIYHSIKLPFDVQAAEKLLKVIYKYALIGRIGKLNTFLLDLENLVDLQSTPDLSKKVEAIKEVLDMCNLPASNLNIQSWVSFNFSTPPAFTSLSLRFEVNSEIEILFS